MRTAQAIIVSSWILQVTWQGEQGGSGPSNLWHWTWARWKISLCAI